MICPLRGPLTCGPASTHTPSPPHQHHKRRLLMTDTVTPPGGGEPFVASASPPPADPQAELAAVQLEEQARYGDPTRWSDPEFQARRGAAYERALGNAPIITSSLQLTSDPVPEP